MLLREREISDRRLSESFYTYILHGSSSLYHDVLSLLCHVMVCVHLIILYVILLYDNRTDVSQCL
jgi:hypothetical protein